MPYLLHNHKQFSPLQFESENEFEQAVVQNKNSLFGKESIYLDVKKKVGEKGSPFAGIPDAFLVDFSNRNSPVLYFVENELSSHDVYSHIAEQLARFSTAIMTSKGQIRDMLLRLIRSRQDLLAEIEEKMKGSPFKNLEELMIYVTEKSDVKITLAIDEETADLNHALSVFRSPPDVVVMQRFVCGGEIVYMYSPMREEVAESAGSSIVATDEYDTIVCPAYESGFQHAYVRNNAWWEIRISQQARERLRYLAIYEKKPIAAVRNVAEIEKIEPYKDTGKFIVYLRNKRKVGPIQLDKGKRGVAPQGPRFTRLALLEKAKLVSELWQ